MLSDSQRTRSRHQETKSSKPAEELLLPTCTLKTNYIHVRVVKVECNSDIHMLSVNREAQEDLTVELEQN